MGSVPTPQLMRSFFDLLQNAFKLVFQLVRVTGGGIETEPGNDAAAPQDDVLSSRGISSCMHGK